MRESALYSLLQLAGLRAQYLGYAYFADAVLLASEDLTRLQNLRRDIYLPVAAKYHVSCTSVERDIRTARDVIFRHQNFEVFRTLGVYPLWKNAQPYPRECIAAFADYLARLS